MTNGNVLVVYYSSTGNTRKVGEAIASALSADAEAIREVNARQARPQSGGLGNAISFVRAGFRAITGRATPIVDSQFDPASYDLLIVGTPVHAGSVSAPVRTYLQRYADRLSKVAFFCTGGDPENRKVFEQMEEICGAKPTAISAFHAPRVEADEHSPQLQEFLAAL